MVEELLLNALVSSDSAGCMHMLRQCRCLPNPGNCCCSFAKHTSFNTMEPLEVKFQSVVAGVADLNGIGFKAFLALPRPRLETLPIPLLSLGNLLEFYDEVHKSQGNIIILVTCFRSQFSPCFCLFLSIFVLYYHMLLTCIFSSLVYYVLLFSAGRRTGY